jgi:hypothetical protein
VDQNLYFVVAAKLQHLRGGLTLLRMPTAADRTTIPYAAQLVHSGVVQFRIMFCFRPKAEARDLPAFVEPHYTAWLLSMGNSGICSLRNNAVYQSLILIALPCWSSPSGRGEPVGLAPCVPCGVDHGHGMSRPPVSRSFAACVEPGSEMFLETAMLATVLTTGKRSRAASRIRG